MYRQASSWMTLSVLVLRSGSHGFPGSEWGKLGFDWLDTDWRHRCHVVHVEGLVMQWRDKTVEVRVNTRWAWSTHTGQNKTKREGGKRKREKKKKDCWDNSQMNEPRSTMHLSFMQLCKISFSSARYIHTHTYVLLSLLEDDHIKDTRPRT